MVGISLSAVTLLWYKRFSQVTMDHVGEYTFQIIKEANKTFELALKDIDYLSTVISLNKPNVIDVLSQDPEYSTYKSLTEDRKLNDFIASLYGYKYYISSILVAGENGKSYSQGTTLSASVIKGLDWYDKIMESNGKKVLIKTHSSTGAVAASPSHNVISVARAIIHNGDTLGFVMIDFRYDMLQKIFSTNLPHENIMFVIDENGFFVYHPDSARLNHNIQDTEFGRIFSQLQLSEGKFEHKIGRQKKFVVYYKSDYTNWTTIGVISQEDMMQQAVKTANGTLVISVITLLIVLTIATIISYRMTRNIFKLRNAMQNVGRGEFDTTITIKSGDEIEELSQGFNRMVIQIKKLLKDVKKNERQKREAELRALQAQINPHFLSNTLNTVKWLATIQKAYNINDLITALIQLLHVSIGKGEELITIQEELEYTKNYIIIQEYRYCDKFKVHFQVEEEILTMKIPKFVLQPIIENSLIHGLEPMEGEGLITIKGYKDTNNIKIAVTDNGVGITADEIDKIFKEERNKNKKRFSGIGIKNVNERIKIHFGEQYGIHIESIPNVLTTVEIIIPCITEEGEERC